MNVLVGEGIPEEILPDVVETELLVDDILGFEDMDAVREGREIEGEEREEEEEDHGE